jgi:hypothetical protein
LADTLFAPPWFRLLITKAEPSLSFTDDLIEAVMSALTEGQARGQHR